MLALCARNHVLPCLLICQPACLLACPLPYFSLACLPLSFSCPFVSVLAVCCVRLPLTAALPAMSCTAPTVTRAADAAACSACFFVCLALLLVVAALLLLLYSTAAVYSIQYVSHEGLLTSLSLLMYLYLFLSHCVKYFATYS